MLRGPWVVAWRIVFTRQAQKDAKKLAASSLRPKAEAVLKVLRAAPFAPYPAYEKLLGDLAGACSRRINIQHRLVYQLIKESRTIKVIRMWTHYE